MTLLIVGVGIYLLCRLLSAISRKAKEEAQRKELERIRAEQERRAAEYARIAAEQKAEKERQIAEANRMAQLAKEQVRMAREQERQRREQERLAKEQERQAAILAKHEEQIAKLQYQIAEAEEDINNISARLEEQQQYAVYLEAQRDKCTPGGKEYFKWSSKLDTVNNRVYQLNRRMGRAMFAKEQAEAKLSA